ncbi:MAG: LacI family DNA-binding transcriptional regulator, partial [Propionicimonas sp.]|nr:LacI family DNA-binding transcriptional regulator [Propionicimonas sp.]
MGGETHDRKPATMQDIASRLGLSRTTVSLVLNDQPARIAEATKELIRQTAKELNYRPSVVARELRLQTSSLVGFVGDAIATGPFGGGLIAGAQSAITGTDQVLLL